MRKCIAGVVGIGIEQIERFHVPGRQPHGRRKTLRAVYVLALVENGEKTFVPTEYRDFDERFRALRNLAAPVRGYGVKQQGEQVRTLGGIMRW